jgi:hypothetical protein
MNRTKKIFISCFITLVVLAMVQVLLPVRPIQLKTFGTQVDSYLRVFSLSQISSNFVSEVRGKNYLIAEVEFDDGSVDIFTYPQSNQMNSIAMNIEKQDKSFLWVDTAKFALRKLKDNNFQKIPMKVHLVKYRTVNNQDQEKDKFFTYEVL